MQMVCFRRRISYLTGKGSIIQFPALLPRLAALIAAILCVMGIGIGKTWAGPPFVTDDPEPVDYKHGEFYVATQYAKDKDVTSGTAPHFELNYGVVPNVMLHLITPFEYVKPEGGATQRGYGDTEVGIKYRFINDEDAHFMVGTFPIVPFLQATAIRV